MLAPAMADILDEAQGALREAQGESGLAEGRTKKPRGEYFG
jgi:hypothetical protein